ncbi:hypothetical protein KW807_01390 [Candidatus Parcubacteria bacterium]|nr:hypothetical protein [Candidatus Parcubacteria bacterium]
MKTLKAIYQDGYVRNWVISMAQKVLGLDTPDEVQRRAGFGLSGGHFMIRWHMVELNDRELLLIREEAYDGIVGVFDGERQPWTVTHAVRVTQLGKFPFSPGMTHDGGPTGNFKFRRCDAGGQASLFESLDEDIERFHSAA